MNDVQKRLMELLAEIDGICQKHDIRYVVGGGLALGYARNGGFLPWDDDIDLFIERKEFERLNQILKKELPENRDWVTHERYPKYGLPLARYVDLSSTQYILLRLNDETPKGQFIEFFVFDPYPDDKEEQAEFDQFLWLYCELLDRDGFDNKPTLTKRIISQDLYKTYYEKVSNEGLDSVLEEIEDKHLTYDESICHFLCARWSVKPLLLKKEWFHRIQRVVIEGVEASIFQDVAEYLYFSEYGYTWNIVPKESRRLTHGTHTFPNVPFEPHLREAMVIGQQYGLDDKHDDYKEKLLQRFFLQLDEQEAVAHQKKAFLESLAERLQKQNWEFEYDKLDELKTTFAPYFDVISKIRYNKWRFNAAIRDDLLETMMATLIYEDRIELAKVFLDIYKDRACTDTYSTIVALIVDLKRYKYEERTDEVKRCLRILEQDYDLGKQVEVERSRIWSLVVDGEVSLERLMEEYKSVENPQDEEIMKYIGDYFYQIDDRQSADRWYEKSHNTRNGILLYDMQKKGFYY